MDEKTGSESGTYLRFGELLSDIHGVLQSTEKQGTFCLLR